MSDMLLIIKDDSKLGFNARVCNRENLTMSVFQGMFGVPFAAEHHKEVAEIVAGLLRENRVDFEDGWIELRVDVVDIAAFFTLRLQDAEDEKSYADQQRYLELQARQKAEAAYTALRDALKLAIGNGAKAAALRFELDQKPPTKGQAEDITRRAT